MTVGRTFDVATVLNVALLRTPMKEFETQGLRSLDLLCLAKIRRNSQS